MRRRAADNLISTFPSSSSNTDLASLQSPMDISSSGVIDAFAFQINIRVAVNVLVLDTATFLFFFT